MDKIIILLALLFAFDVSAAERYASTSGSGSTCSIGSPCTLNTALSGAAANDIIYLRTGTYSAPSANPASGTGGNYTTISNYNGETVTVNGVWPAFYSSSLNYIKLLGTGSRVFKINNNSSSDEAIIIANGSHHIWLENLEITGSLRQGIFLARVADQSSGYNTVKNSWIHHHGTDHFDHCIYIESHDNLIEYNKIDHCYGYGIHQYNGYAEEANNNIYRYNLVSDNAIETGQSTGQAIISRGNGSQFYGNILYGGLTNGAVGLDISRNNGSGNIFYNNVIYQQAIGISVGASSVASVIRNNAIANNTSNFEINGSGTHTRSNNFCTTSGGTTNCSASGASAGFVDAANGNFSLIAGSALINAGTASIATGITACANGSAPDIGAIETLGAPSATVDGTAAVITVPNNCTAQMLPVSSVTGWTFKKNGSSDTVTANSRSGTNSFAATLTSAFTGGDTCLFSYSQTGNTTSDNGVGGATTNNQEVLAFTDASCTNITAGGGPTLAYTHGRWYLLQGATDTAWVPKGAADANVTVAPGAKLNLRWKVKNTGADTSLNPRIRVSYDGGGYVELTSSYVNAVKALGSGAQLGTVMSDSSPMTQDQLTSDVANIACTYIRNPVSAPNLSLTTNTETECGAAIDFDTSAVAGKQYDFKIYTDTGTAISGGPISAIIGGYSSQH